MDCCRIDAQSSMMDREVTYEGQCQDEADSMKRAMSARVHGRSVPGDLLHGQGTGFAFFNPSR